METSIGLDDYPHIAVNMFAHNDYKPNILSRAVG